MGKMQKQSFWGVTRFSTCYKESVGATTPGFFVTGRESLALKIDMEIMAVYHQLKCMMFHNVHMRQVVNTQ